MNTLNTWGDVFKAIERVYEYLSLLPFIWLLIYILVPDWWEYYFGRYSASVFSLIVLFFSTIFAVFGAFLIFQAKWRKTSLKRIITGIILGSSFCIFYFGKVVYYRFLVKLF